MEQKIVKVSFILFLAFLTPLFSGEADAAVKNSTGWPLFRTLQSVRPKPLTSTYYTQGDLSGILYNPALLAELTGQEINADLATAGEARSAGSLYGRRITDTVSIAAGIFSYDYGKMELSWIENGQFRERTVSAQSDYMAMFSAGKALSPRFSMGVNVKAASSRIAEEATAYAFALDGGISYYTKSGLKFSLMGQNVGSATKFVEKSETLPTALTAGVSYLKNVGGFYVLTGCEVPYLLSESRTTPSLGIEIGKWPLGIFAGYRTYADDAKLSYGITLALNTCDFSYSYTPAKYLDSTHRMALGIKLGQDEDFRKEIKKAHWEKISREEEQKRKEQEARQLRAREEAAARASQETNESTGAVLGGTPLSEAMKYRDATLNQLLPFVSSSAFHANFYLASIVDTRREKTVIGSTLQGVVNLRKTSKLLLLDMLPWFAMRDNVKTPVLLNIKALSFTEDSTGIVADAEMEFYIRKGSFAEKAYNAKSHISQPLGGDAKALRYKVIQYVVYDSVYQFIQEYWNKKPLGRITYKTAATSRTVSKRHDHDDSYTSRLALGFGVPYGVIGTNCEVSVSDYAALSAGLGIAPGGAAYAAGGRLYFLPKTSAFRPRFTVFWGTVAFIEYSTYYSSEKKYENRNGFALGAGFSYTYTESSLDMDLLLLNYKVPAGAKTDGNNLKLSIGYGWHF